MGWIVITYFPIESTLPSLYSQRKAIVIFQKTRGSTVDLIV